MSFSDHDPTLHILGGPQVALATSTSPKGPLKPPGAERYEDRGLIPRTIAYIFEAGLVLDWLVGFKFRDVWNVKKQQSKIFSIKTRDSSTLIFWCFGSWGFKHDTYIMLHSFVVSCAADFSGPHSVMWMGAPWAPHTLNDSASELFLHWLVGWLVIWLVNWC